MRDLRAFVFDLFHTLVDPEDHRPADFDRTAAVAEILDVPVAPFVRWWDSLEEARTRGTTPPNTELFARAVAANGGEVDDEVLAEADRVYGRYQDQALREPRPDIVEVVRALHETGRPIGLLSNTESRDIHAWVDSPLAPFFTAAVFSSGIQAVKPDLLPYAVVLSALGFPSVGKVAYVGDGGSDELTGARGARIGRVVAARWFVPANGLRTEEEQKHAERDADVAVRDVGDLLGRLL